MQSVTWNGLVALIQRLILIQMVVLRPKWSHLRNATVCHINLLACVLLGVFIGAVWQHVME